MPNPPANSAHSASAPVYCPLLLDIKEGLRARTGPLPSVKSAKGCPPALFGTGETSASLGGEAKVFNTDKKDAGMHGNTLENGGEDDYTLRTHF